MSIVPVRGGVRSIAHRWLRLLPAGALLVCSLLSACSRSNTGSAQPGWPAARSWPGNVPALAVSNEPARPWTVGPGSEPAAIGELPAVIVEVQREGTCPIPRDRFASVLLERTEHRC
jgi:hypothetical protein